MTFVGNVGSLSSVGCFTSAAYSHNVWYSPAGYTAQCGPSDKKYSSTASTTFWAAPGVSSFDYTPLTPIQGAGENAYCQAADINGKSRPTSAPCDAGAFQH